MTFDDIWAVYQTVWGEARGETFQGMLGVAFVILNRVEDPRWPDTAFRVCHDKWQFSAWNPSNPNLGKMKNLDTRDLNKEVMEATLTAVGGDAEDPTLGATHYFAAYIEPPSWASSLSETAQIGRHRFFR